jgi:hypothetical protein
MMIGKQVSWEKLTGKPNASMHETSGFGVLASLEIGHRMIISGDYGFSSSLVKSVQADLFGIRVTTASSTYLVKERK